MFSGKIMKIRIISNVCLRCLPMLLGMVVCSHIKFYYDSLVNDVKRWHNTILSTTNDNASVFFKQTLNKPNSIIEQYRNVSLHLKCDVLKIGYFSSSAVPFPIPSERWCTRHFANASQQKVIKMSSQSVPWCYIFIQSMIL